MVIGYGGKRLQGLGSIQLNPNSQLLWDFIGLCIVDLYCYICIIHVHHKVSLVSLPVASLVNGYTYQNYI